MQIFPNSLIKFMKWGRKDNGISTYHKIFVKDYIYTFRFTCDEEYVDIYKNYIENIEDNFKTTN